MTTIGQSVKRLRDERGWSQYQLAVKSGLSPANIHKVETGATVSSSVDTARKLATALGIPLSELTGETTLSDRPPLTREEHAMAFIRTHAPHANPQLARHLLDTILELDDEDMRQLLNVAEAFVVRRKAREQQE